MAQVKPLKLLANGDMSYVDTANDDLTMGSLTGKSVTVTNDNTGEKLTIQANAGDAESKIFNVKDSSGVSVASIDEDGDMIVNDITVNGVETVVGSITTQSSLNVEGAFSVSGAVTLGDEATDAINFIGQAGTNLNMNSNEILGLPATPTQNDAATSKSYVDAQIASVDLSSRATTELDNLTSTSINADLIPDDDSTRSLGSSASAWATTYTDALDTTSGTNLVLKRGGAEQFRLDSFGMFASQKIIMGANLEFNMVDSRSVGSPAVPGNSAFFNRFYIRTATKDAGQIISNNGIAFQMNAKDAGDSLRFYTVSNSSGDSRPIELSTGTSFNDDSGDITLTTGNAYNGVRGSITLDADIDGAVLAKAPSGTGSTLAIATVGYVDSAIAGIDTSGFMLLDGSQAMTADMDLGGNKIVSLATPTASGDAANKQYVDDQISTSPRWSLSGNSLSGGEVFGSTNDQDVVFQRNGSEYMRFNNSIFGIDAVFTEAVLGKYNSTLGAAFYMNLDEIGAVQAVAGGIPASGVVEYNGADVSNQTRTGVTYHQGDLIEVNDGNTYSGATTRFVGSSANLDSVDGAFNSGSVYLESESAFAAGSASGAVVNSGNITIQTGYAQNGGTRGSITLNANADDVLLANAPTGGTSLAVATVGYVDSAISGIDISGFMLLDGTQAMTADMDLGSNRIVSVADPVDAQDAATKIYVDAAVAAVNTSEDVALTFTASGAVAAGAPVYVVSSSDDTVAEGDASAIGTSRLIGIAESTISDSATGKVTISGFATIPTGQIDGGSFTVGYPVYLSETAGNLTSTAPSTSGSRVYQVGVATASDKLVIDLKQGITVT